MSKMNSFCTGSISPQKPSSRRNGHFSARFLVAVLATLLAGLFRPADAVWQQVAKYWDGACTGAFLGALGLSCSGHELNLLHSPFPAFSKSEGAPSEVLYAENANITSCATLPSPLNTCTMARNSSNVIVGSTKVLYCSDTRPVNWTVTYPPEMNGESRGQQF